MEIEQKHCFNSTQFIFDRDHLSYTRKHLGGSLSFDMNYVDIPMENWDLEERIPWFCNTGIVLMMIWFCQILSGLIDPLSAAGTFLHWPLAAICCLGIYRYAVTRFTVFKTDQGKLYLICDDQYEAVMDEINSRRKSQLLIWYGEIDYTNDPGEEIQKFHWLKQQGVIGDDEFESICTRIHVFHGPMQETDFMEGPSIN